MLLRAPQIFILYFCCCVGQQLFNLCLLLSNHTVLHNRRFWRTAVTFVAHNSGRNGEIKFIIQRTIWERLKKALNSRRWMRCHLKAEKKRIYVSEAATVLTTLVWWVVENCHFRLKSHVSRMQISENHLQYQFCVRFVYFEASRTVVYFFWQTTTIDHLWKWTQIQRVFAILSTNSFGFATKSALICNLRFIRRFEKWQRVVNLLFLVEMSQK